MKIIVFARGGIGDVLMTTPMFRAIKKNYPNSFLTICVEGSSQNKILEGNKYIDDLIDLSSAKYKNFSGFLRLLIRIRKEKYDCFFHNHIIRGIKYYFLPVLSSINERYGFNRLGMPNKSKLISKNKFLTKSLEFPLGYNTRTSMNLRLLKFIGITYTNLEYDLFLIEKDKLSKITQTKIIGIHPGGDNKNKLKRWPIAKFVQLAKKLSVNNEYKIIFFIGPDEKELLTEIYAEFKIFYNIKLDALTYEMSNCNYFISNDSGLSHIAAALKIPTLVVFGPTIKNEYLLPTKYMVAEDNSLSCRPCLHLKKKCSIGEICLTELKVDYVHNKFLELRSIVSTD